jgi:hypothetical protein
MHSVLCIWTNVGWRVMTVTVSNINLLVSLLVLPPLLFVAAGTSTMHAYVGHG